MPGGTSTGHVIHRVIHRHASHPVDYRSACPPQRRRSNTLRGRVKKSGYPPPSSTGNRPSDALFHVKRSALWITSVDNFAHREAAAPSRRVDGVFHRPGAPGWAADRAESISGFHVKRGGRGLTTPAREILARAGTPRIARSTCAVDRKDRSAMKPVSPPAPMAKATDLMPMAVWLSSGGVVCPSEGLSSSGLETRSDDDARSPTDCRTHVIPFVAATPTALALQGWMASASRRRMIRDWGAPLPQVALRTRGRVLPSPPTYEPSVDPRRLVRTGAVNGAGPTRQPYERPTRRDRDGREGYRGSRPDHLQPDTRWWTGEACFECCCQHTRFKPS